MCAIYIIISICYFIICVLCVGVFCGYDNSDISPFYIVAGLLWPLAIICSVIYGLYIIGNKIGNIIKKKL